jgi:hypothetical protein
MDNPSVSADHDVVYEVLGDLVMTRLVSVVNLASLSILELLEYGFTRIDINRAMAKGIVEFNRRQEAEAAVKTDILQRIFEKEEYYFALLSSKIHLTKFGQFILEIIQEDEEIASRSPMDTAQPTGDEESLFLQRVPHV